VGIGEAGYHVACLLGDRFGVVTTLPQSVPALRHNIARYGLAARCTGVRATDIPVLALHDPASGAEARVAEEIVRAVADDGAEAVVPGCAGMASLAAALAERHGVPVVEGVAAAVKLAEALVALGLRTSKIGGWAAPRPKARGAASTWLAPHLRS
jgi:allantoin racemase